MDNVSVTVRPVSSFDDAPSFLSVESGDFVIIEESISTKQSEKQGECWVGKVLACFGGARDPTVNTIFQVENIDT